MALSVQPQWWQHLGHWQMGHRGHAGIERQYRFTVQPSNLPQKLCQHPSQARDGLAARHEAGTLGVNIDGGTLYEVSHV